MRRHVFFLLLCLLTGLPAALLAAGPPRDCTDYANRVFTEWDRVRDQYSATPGDLQRGFTDQVLTPLRQADQSRLDDVNRMHAATGVKPAFSAGSPPHDTRFRPGGDYDLQHHDMGDYYRHRDELIRRGYQVKDNGNSYTVVNHNATYHMPPGPYDPTFQPASRSAWRNDPEAAPSVIQRQQAYSVVDPRTGRVLSQGPAYLDNPTVRLGDYVKKNHEAAEMLARPGLQNQIEALNFTNKSVVKTVNDLRAFGIDLGVDTRRLSLEDINQAIANRHGADLDDYIRQQIGNNQRILEQAAVQSADWTARHMNDLRHAVDRAEAAGDLIQAQQLRAQYQNTAAAIRDMAEASDNRYILEQVFGPEGRPPAVRGEPPPSKWSQSLTWVGRALAVLSGIEGARREREAAAAEGRDPSYLLAIGRGVANFLGADRAWETGRAEAEQAIRDEIEAAQREGREPNLDWARFTGMLSGIERFTGAQDVRNLVTEAGGVVWDDLRQLTVEGEQRATQEDLAGQLLGALRGKQARLRALRAQLDRLANEVEAGRATLDAAKAARQALAGQAAALLARIQALDASQEAMPGSAGESAIVGAETVTRIEALANDACLLGRDKKTAQSLAAQAVQLLGGMEAGQTPPPPPVDGAAAGRLEARLGEARSCVAEAEALQRQAQDASGQEQVAALTAKINTYQGLLADALALQAQIQGSVARLRQYSGIIGELTDIDMDAAAALPGGIAPIDATVETDDPSAGLAGEAQRVLNTLIGIQESVAQPAQDDAATNLARARAAVMRARQCAGGDQRLGGAECPEGQVRTRDGGCVEQTDTGQALQLHGNVQRQRPPPGGGGGAIGGEGGGRPGRFTGVGLPGGGDLSGGTGEGDGTGTGGGSGGGSGTGGGSGGGTGSGGGSGTGGGTGSGGGTGTGTGGGTGGGTASQQKAWYGIEVIYSYKMGGTPCVNTNHKEAYMTRAEAEQLARQEAANTSALLRGVERTDIRLIRRGIYAGPSASAPVYPGKSGSVCTR